MKRSHCNQIVCMTSVKHPNKIDLNVDPARTINFDFGEALESVYPLLEIVFRYLDFKDLKTASLVNKQWQISANNVLNKRNKLSWISASRKDIIGTVHCSPNYSYSNINVGIVFFNFRSISLSDSLCYHEELAKRKIKFSDYLSEKIVPWNVEYCVIGCSDIISNFVAPSKFGIPLFDCLLIPPIPHVKISMFYCNPKKMPEDFIKSEERLKCLLLFCKNDLKKNICRIFERLMTKHDVPHVALGGGIIRSMVFPQRQCNPKDRQNTLCIAITENKLSLTSQFEAASVVINGNDLSPEEFADKLKKFKNNVIVRSNSLAIRICCSAKSEKKHETKVFEKIFPNTHLSGFEAEGEIGWDCFMPPYEDKSKVNNFGFPKAHHQWSTVFVLLTWGDVLAEMKQE